MCGKKLNKSTRANITIKIIVRRKILGQVNIVTMLYTNMASIGNKHEQVHLGD